MEETIYCAECKQVVDTKTQEHVWDAYVEVYSDRWGSRNLNAFGAFHLDCLDNIHKPEHLRVCDACGIQGKDATGGYPGVFRRGFIEHAECVDFGDEQHLQEVMRENRYE